MPRNDSILYSGASSASFAKGDMRKSKENEKRQKKVVLSPVKELVLGELQKEIDSFTKQDFAKLKLLIHAGNKTAVDAEILSDEKAMEKLINVKNRLSNILRSK
jgi:hypothetical protein